MKKSQKRAHLAYLRGHIAMVKKAITESGYSDEAYRRLTSLEAQVEKTLKTKGK